MSASKQVRVEITGSVPDDYNDNDYKVLIAKLNVICAEYDLHLREE